MLNVALLWYLVLPIILSAISFFIVRRYAHLDILQSVGVAVGGLFISALIITGIFYAGKGSKTHDTEILNGEVLSKDRRHDSYVRTYQCNCYQSCSGTGQNRSCHQVCQTCYEDHYTVTWSCRTNIGDFTIEHLDRTTKRVYKTPDPQRYTIIQKGDPVSKTHGYTNYIKAVPESLFRPASKELLTKFKGQIPSYPIRIYDYYHVDRVLPVGVQIPNLKEWNSKLSEVLKKLGPAKQANAVIVITRSNDPNYFYALQDAWVNGKKNDIVLVIGAPEFPKKAAWVRIMALTKDQIFQVKLRDSILALEELTADSVIGTLEKETYTSFKRKSMKDFAYLDAEIDPPAWMMIACIIVNFLAYVGFWWFVYYHRSSNSYGRFGTPRFRRRY